MFLLSLIPVLVCVSHARVREAHPEINSTMGTQFLFAIPDLLHANGMAYLYIFCVVNPLTLVSVFTYGPNFNTTVVRLQVIKNDFTVYSIDVPKGISPIGKKTTYEVAAGVALGLYIVLHANPPNVAVITMIPLSSWGREYFAMTLMSTPTIIVTTNNDNRINVLLKITTAVGSDKPSSSEIHYGNEVYTNGDSLKINLQQKESFSVSMCNPADKFGSLLGTRIMAKEPVGVISGSCLSETLSVTCNNDREIISTSQDMAVENIPPTEYYGTEFIMFIIPNRIAQGEITAFASNDITNVTLAGEKGARGENFFLAKQGDVHIIRYNSIRLITSTRPIMMLFTLVSACVSTSAAASQDIGEAALTLVVPMRLYFFIYLFRVPEHLFTNPVAVLIYRKIALSNITMDGEPISRLSHTTQVTGNDKWQISYYRIESTVTHVCQAHETLAFGLYVYGLSPSYAYMFPVGYRTQVINPKNKSCVITIPVPDDLIDNDCDGRIDEEEYDFQDDDFDSKIDEDIFIKLVNGQWGRWSEWQCSNHCNQTSKERRRNCDNPPPSNGGSQCTGKSFERQPHNCYEETLCPSNCPSQKRFEIMFL
ncbi:uncharacterized protein LOC106064769 isoform X2 [Biomphalaria glabrata]|uniref:Uncharacterized protein LOC106064769 isoform X2 n=1 Tax=Biomphalaria glabrata TaxID=6526 RepID=A0A9W2ZCI5_BIOGL|nr:uncharacterized protein LOC106064769 isoform X2 [Biomphalaria glabrata]